MIYVVKNFVTVSLIDNDNNNNIILRVEIVDIFLTYSELN